jgi:hypothetical protein
METLAIHVWSDNPPAYKPPGVQRLIVFLALEGVWMDLFDSETEESARNSLSEYNINTYATMDEIREGLLAYAATAGFRSAEMRDLRLRLGVGAKVKNNFHTNGHNGDGDQAGDDGS